ncbi:MAG: hypothetical protein ABS75_34150 [Pelagibacterium sp. SCN 63-23]|nr:MAG: hypothetical protein ABS75_34150 [Pelagibacterium sp. SCN 63-23]
MLPKWAWHWAWRAFMIWSLSPTMAYAPNARQRWAIVFSCLWPGIKHHYLSPMRAWLQRRLPGAVATARLKRHGAGWYSVPSAPAAIHFWRRTGVCVHQGDFVRIERALVTMKGFVDEDRQVCEFWFLAIEDEAQFLAESDRNSEAIVLI